MASQSQGLQQVQKQTQNLVLAPQLRQSLKILQVPAQELRTTILEELQTNPVLEELAGTEESLDAEIAEQDAPEGDVAEEATSYARFQILVATGTQMLKQANQLPQGAIELLR